MDAKKILAVLLIIGGGLVIAYGGFGYSKETHSADIGDMHLAVHERQQVNIPLWAGLAAVIAGVALLATGRRT